MKPRHIRLGRLLITVLAMVGLPAVQAGPVQPFLNQLVQREGLPGAALLVSGPQGRELAVAGVAHRKTREPVTEHTRFYIASAGKLVTAAATLQLVQEGKVKLSAPVWPWLKDIPDMNRLRQVRSVTVEQLLKHRSGLAEYFTDDFEAAAAEQPRKRWTAVESLAFAFDEKAPGKPGREHLYTNTNYVLLGLLLEQADQSSYAQAVQRRVLAPLGMNASTVGARAGEAGLAHGYSRDGPDNPGQRLQDVSASGWNAITGDGAMVTTLEDWENFLFALFRDGKLLPPATVKRMCQPQAEEPDSGYGLGCQVMGTPWGEAWGHNGSISGFNADTWYIPRLGVAVVFFTNGDFNTNEPDVVVKAVRAYLKH